MAIQIAVVGGSDADGASLAAAEAAGPPWPRPAP